MERELWTVERHSGRNSTAWCVAFSGEEPKARAKFDRIHTALRQGGVRLIRPDGHTAFIVHAPRLRTRW